MDWSAAAQIGGDIIGKLQSQGKDAEAKALYQAALARFGNVTEPNLEAIAPQVLGPSAAGGVQADPQMRAAQLDAMAKLQNIEDTGGMTIGDRAKEAQAMNVAARTGSAGRNAIASSMAARGMGGSGSDLAMQLANQQNSAEMANQAGTQSAGEAQRRYFDAILQRGKMAGDIRGQTYEEQMRAAQAQDLRDQYNAGQRTDAAKYNNTEAQQGFNNQITKATGSQGATGALAGFDVSQAQGDRNQDAAIGAAAAQGLKDKSGGDYSTPPLLNTDDLQTKPDEWNAWTS